jgi:hypothetical protein
MNCTAVFTAGKGKTPDGATADRKIENTDIV